jgi:hypothetical protein
VERKTLDVRVGRFLYIGRIFVTAMAVTFYQFLPIFGVILAKDPTLTKAA